MTFEWNRDDEVHRRTLDRLETERVGWLATAGRDGYPHTVPIWFLWQDERALIFSEPETAKVRNIRADARVALHLETGADGEQLSVLRGVATLRDDATAAALSELREPYVAKYAGGLENLGWSLDEMAARYSTIIEVTPHKLIAW